MYVVPAFSICEIEEFLRDRKVPVTPYCVVVSSAIHSRIPWCGGGMGAKDVMEEGRRMREDGRNLTPISKLGGKEHIRHRQGTGESRRCTKELRKQGSRMKN